MFFYDKYFGAVWIFLFYILFLENQEFQDMDCMK